MIRYFLLQNKQGKTRLSKWYSTAPDDLERVKLEADVHRTISMRGRGYTNFVEVSLPRFRAAFHISSNFCRVSVYAPQMANLVFFS